MLLLLLHRMSKQKRTTRDDYILHIVTMELQIVLWAKSPCVLGVRIMIDFSLIEWELVFSIPDN